MEAWLPASENIKQPANEIMNAITIQYAIRAVFN